MTEKQRKRFWSFYRNLNTEVVRYNEDDPYLLETTGDVPSTNDVAPKNSGTLYLLTNKKMSTRSLIVSNVGQSWVIIHMDNNYFHHEAFERSDKVSFEGFEEKLRAFFPSNTCHFHHHLAKVHSSLIYLLADSVLKTVPSYKETVSWASILHAFWKKTPWKKVNPISLSLSSKDDVVVPLKYGDIKPGYVVLSFDQHVSSDITEVKKGFDQAQLALKTTREWELELGVVFENPQTLKQKTHIILRPFGDPGKWVQCTWSGQAMTTYDFSNLPQEFECLLLARQDNPEDYYLVKEAQDFVTGLNVNQFKAAPLTNLHLRDGLALKKYSLVSWAMRKHVNEDMLGIKVFGNQSRHQVVFHKFGEEEKKEPLASKCGVTEFSKFPDPTVSFSACLIFRADTRKFSLLKRDGKEFVLCKPDDQSPEDKETTERFGLSEFKEYKLTHTSEYIIKFFDTHTDNFALLASVYFASQ